MRHREGHRSGRSGWLRAAVLGANDGIVSTASLILGVAAAHATSEAILTAGVASLAAGAMSMAAGEYVSVSSQSDMEEAETEVERRELEGHVLERGDQWREVRRQRKAFEEILSGVLARGEAEGSLRFADRGLALRALLGMVNHTVQWFRPRGRLSAEQVADGYVDLLLGRAGG